MVTIDKIIKIKELIEKFKNEYVSSMLFMCNFEFKLMLLEAVDLDLSRFNLFISADWIDNQNSYELKQKLFNYLRINSTDDIYVLIRAILFVHTSDQTVQYFNNLYNFNNQNITFIPSMQIGNNLIENAYLLNPEKHEKAVA